MEKVMTKNALMKESKIQTLAMCVFRHKNTILVREEYDDEQKVFFYKPLGGKLTFGEYSWEALRREIKEDIGEDIKNLTFIGPAENIYNQNGHTEHELIFMFEGEFVNRSVYKKEDISLSGKNGIAYRAVWKPVKDFTDNGHLLYPEGLLEILTE